MNNNPIGIFDSGIGGLTIWKEIVKHLPHESIYFYADSANCPYGSKNRDEIIILSKKIVDFLIKQGCKVVVIACNSATAAAIDYLRENYSLPFVGMEPAVKMAAENTVTGNIGILATEMTFNGRHFNETSDKFAHHVNVHVQVGYGLVELAEKGMIESVEAKQLLQQYLKPMIEQDIDQVVLGCTHYPFYIEQMRALVPQGVTIIDPAQAVARQTKRVLIENEFCAEENNKRNYTFYSSGNIDVLENVLKQITDVPYNLVL